jgi:hypothetical protein
MWPVIEIYPTNYEFYCFALLKNFGVPPIKTKDKTAVAPEMASATAFISP